MLQRTANFHFYIATLVGLSLLVGSGCQPGERVSLPLLRRQPQAVTLTIQAEAMAEGKVAVAGRTNLPKETQLTALALRYLEPAQPLAAPAQPTFSILDYQTIPVQQGQWQAELDLWQVAEDGRYQEAWQHQAQQLDLPLQPEDTVHFIVTLAPKQFLAALNRDLGQNRIQLSSDLLRTNDSGELLLWAEDSQLVDLPEGRTSPPDPLTQQANGGWGERYRLVPEPPLPYRLTPEDTRKTTAPPATEEFLH